MQRPVPEPMDTLSINRRGFLGAALATSLPWPARVQSPPPAPGVSDLAGRPPNPPAWRVDPWLYDMTFRVQVLGIPAFQEGDVASNTETMRLTTNRLVLSMSTLDTWSRVDPASIRATATLTGAPRRSIPVSMADSLGGTRLVTLDTGAVSCQSIQWELQWRVQVWSSLVDEDQAQRVTWPRSWPAEVEPWLRPSVAIESDDPRFAQHVQSVSGGKLKDVPIWLATKDLVRHTVLWFRGIDSFGNITDTTATRGFQLQGAASAMESRKGSVYDLCAACVATLRAAGIPARPVLGMIEAPQGTITGGMPQFRLGCWAEAYLPSAGWMPFDPDRIFVNGAKSLDVLKPWDRFGTWAYLNYRAPISHDFLPAMQPQPPVQYPGMWGWIRAGGIDPSCQLLDYLTCVMVDRGVGQWDPGPAPRIPPAYLLRGPKPRN